MIKVGLVGLGFMGQKHLELYQKMSDKVAVTAVADPDPRKRAGQLDAVGNIGAGGQALSLDGIAPYESLEDMLAEAEIDVVDITLPTYLHRGAAIHSFTAGKHVICEKPMAMGYSEAMDMVTAAEQAGRCLYVGQCIRFWPAYAKAYEIIRSASFGKVRTAAFSRLSPRPVWAWQSWSLDQKRSGGAALDLHIHDADFISYLFGPPVGVSAFAGGRDHPESGPIDHITACYHYDDDKLVTATGAWEYPSGFPFSMTFAIHLEHAALALTGDGRLMLYRDGAEPEQLPVKDGDGWHRELNHFVYCAAAGKNSDVISPRDAALSVQLIRLEMESARTGRRVDLPLA